MGASLQWPWAIRVGVIRFGPNHLDWQTADPYTGVAVVLDRGNGVASICGLAGDMPPETYDIVMDILAAEFKVLDVSRRGRWFRYDLTAKPYTRRPVSP